MSVKYPIISLILLAALAALLASAQEKPKVDASKAGGTPSVLPPPDFGQVALSNEAAPRILNKSWTLRADIDVPEAGVEGMIATHGGLVGGYGLYVRDGKPTFVYNYLALDRFTFTGQEPLPKGKVQLEVDVAYAGGSGTLGNGAAVTMLVNGKTVAHGQLRKTIPNQISLGEGFDVGMDRGSAVDVTYKLPFTFTGTIEKVTVELK